MEKHFTVQEVASYLRISRWSVGRYIDDGELTAIKGNGRSGAVRIPASELAAFIERHTVTGGAMTTTTLPDMVLLEEVAERYQLSLIGLQRKARKKGFTHVKIGKRRFLTPEHVKALLATYTVASDTQTEEDRRTAELAAAGERALAARSRRGRRAAA